MTVIKTLGRREGWRNGAVLVKLDRPLRWKEGSKTRQTSRAVVSSGWMYPVNRVEQVVGMPIKARDK